LWRVRASRLRTDSASAMHLFSVVSSFRTVALRLFCAEFLGPLAATGRVEYSVWPADRDVPARPPLGSHTETCGLNRIDRMWTDTRPLSLCAAHHMEVPN